MHGSGIPIWFFIGVLLVIYGGMILATASLNGRRELIRAGVQLTNLHTPVWWGGMLAALGLFYVVKFRPGRASK